jgi:lipopolysaccharide/colanic/teichoic acid biosynthesis glycosyltransferase
MKSCTARIQQKSFPTPQSNNNSPEYKLQWRQGQLFVKRSEASLQLYMRSVESQQELVKCLKHSPVRLVRLDTTLGEAALKSWVKACEEAKKPVFLWQTVEQKQQRKPIKLSWNVKIIDLIVSFFLLILLSPVILTVAVLQSYVYSLKSIFTKEWCVGSRGKLFQALRFRTTEVNNDTCTTALGEWLCKYQLDKLPQLLNILRGEMSLFGSPTLNLSEAVELGSEEKRHSSVLSWEKLTDGYVTEV